MRTIPLNASNLDEAIDFIARLNQINEHNIGYFSESAQEITADFRAIQPPEGFGRIVVSDHEKLVGLLGVEVDIELGRCWLYGPLVDTEDWDLIADLLYEAVLADIPQEISDQEIYFHKQNVRLQGFALRQGFPLHSEGAILTLDAGQLGDFSNSNPIEFSEEHATQFIALHAVIFPNTYYSGEQLIKLAEDDDKRLFIHLIDDVLVGYVFIQGREAYKDGYIDFIGVDERFRRQGVAKNLVAGALNWFSQFPYVEKVTLTVNTINTPAVRMYQRLGFRMENVSQAYRKRT